jgi:tetratricopeptide (TPR) repeat protein
MGIITTLLNDPAQDAGFWYGKAQELAGAGYYLDALEALDRMLHEEPAHAPSWFLKGYVLYQMGRFDEALQLFDRALSHDPGLHDALVYKGLLASNSGRHSEALRLYDRALALSPGSVPAWYARGLTLAILDRYDEAILSYEQVLAYDPQHLDALTGIGSAMKKRDRARAPREFPAQLEKARQSPDNARPPVQPVPAAAPIPAVVMYEGTHPVSPAPLMPQPAPATRTLPAEPASPELFTGSPRLPDRRPGRDVVRETPYPGAVAESATTVITPRAPSSQSASHYTEMIDQLRQDLASRPRDVGSWHALGDQFLKIGKYRQATEAYETALECDTGRAETWTSLGDARKKLGVYDEALFAYEQALSLEPDRPAAWISHAKTLAMLGRYPEAILSCDRATALDETSIDAWLYKGFILRKISRDEDALVVYDHVLELSPHHEHAARQRRSLIGGE